MDTMNYKLDFDEYLVSLIAEHPGIYDKRNDHYKDYRRKLETWESVANKLNLDAESVRRRWENLRDRFVRAYREYTASGNNPLVKSKFKLFNQMSWLAPHIRKRRMTSSLFVANSKIPACQLAINDDTQSNEAPETQDYTNLKADLEDSVNVKTETQSNLSDATYHDSFLDEDALLSSTSVADGLAQTNATEVPNKSDHYFMMSVVHDCRNMCPRKKLKFKKEVLGLLERYLYDDDNIL